MDVREKLVGIVCDAMESDGCVAHCNHAPCFPVERVVNALIGKGVTVQELDGCEYCKEDNEGFRRMFGAFSLVNPFHGKGWQIHAGKCNPREIYYCPMCGKKLPQPPKGE